MRLEQNLVLCGFREDFRREYDTRSDVNLFEYSDVFTCTPQNLKHQLAFQSEDVEKSECVPRIAIDCLSFTRGAPSTRDQGPSLQSSPMIEYNTHECFYRAAYEILSQRSAQSFPFSSLDHFLPPHNLIE